MASKNQVTLTLAGDEKKLTVSTEKAGEATEKLADRVKKSSDQLERATGKATEESGKSFGGFVGKIGEVGFALQGLSTVGDLISDTLGGMDLGGKLQAQLGKSSEEAGKVGAVAGKVYADNFGENLDDVGTAVSNVVRNVGDVGKLGEEGMKKVTESALTLRDVFDIDVTESTNAVGHLLKTGLVKDAQEGMDLVTVAFQKIPNAAEDATDTLSEYAVQFQQLGLNGPAALGLISQGMQAGARNTDLIADALKEFTLLAVDKTSTAGQGFKDLGLNAGKMADDIAAGGPRASKALDLTLDRLRAIKNPTDQSRIAVELFGTKAEDLQNSLFALDPSTATASLGDVAGAAQRAGDAMAQGPTAKLEAAKRAFLDWSTNVISGVVVPAITAFVDFLNATLVPVLSGMVDWLKENWNWLSVVLAVIAAMAAPIVAVSLAMAAWAKIMALVEAAQIALNLAMNMNPIVLIVSLIAGLVVAFVMLWNKSAAFRDFFIGIWDAIKGAVGASVQWIVDRWNDVIGWFKGLPGKVGEALGSIGRFIGDAFKGGLNVAIDIINWFIRRYNDIIDGINWVSPFDDIPHIPQVPRMHSGGVVSGSPGSEQLRILQAGETVIPVGGSVSGSGMTVTFGGNVDSAFATAFMKLVRDGSITIT